MNVSLPDELRAFATDDIDGAVDHYQREVGTAVAGRFVDASSAPSPA